TSAQALSVILELSEESRFEQGCSIQDSSSRGAPQNDLKGVTPLTSVIELKVIRLELGCGGEGQHWTGCAAHHLFRDAPHDHVRETLAAVRLHHDKVSVDLLRDLYHRLGERAGRGGRHMDLVLHVAEILARDL